VNQLLEPVAHGVVSGMLWALLVCLLFMMPRIGAAIDAASPAFEQQLAVLGISEDLAKQTARTLRSGNAALFLLIREKVLAGLRAAGGMVTRSSFDETKAEVFARGARGGPRDRILIIG
jgi:uncharacterized membrane protein